MVPGGRLVVLGKQGAGKGTQCLALSHHYYIPHISTGDMLRAAVKARNPLGLEAEEHMDAGELIPDQIVLEMVRERLEQDDTRSRGFVLDGFPRTVAQAKGLEELLLPAELDLAIDIEVPTEVALSRLAGRRTCADCGQIYSTTRRPSVDWTCDVCGGEVVQRDDDTDEAIRLRLSLYETETAPLIEWYERQGKLSRIPGLEDPDVVFDRIVEEVDGRRAEGGFGPPMAVAPPDPAPVGPSGNSSVAAPGGPQEAATPAPGAPAPPASRQSGFEVGGP